jgi:hypothetical protein
VRWLLSSGAVLTQNYCLVLVEDFGRFYVSDLGPVFPGAATKTNSNPSYDSTMKTTVVKTTKEQNRDR